MSRIPGIRRFFRIPRNLRRQALEEVDQEIQFHLDLRTQELIDRGSSPGNARERALQEFGDLEGARRGMRRSTRNRYRKDRTMDLLHDLVHDIRFSLRSMGRSRGFTLVVLLTLALGIGADTAVFSVTDAVLFRPFGYDEPDRIVTVWETNIDRGLPYMYAAPTNFHDWRTQSTSFEQMGVYNPAGYFIETEEGVTRIQGTDVSAGVFDLLGVQPAMGRRFTETDDVPGALLTIIISDGLWKERYGRDPDIIGKHLRLTDTDGTIIGVMPPGFDFPPPISLEGRPPAEPSRLWTAMREELANPDMRGAHYMTALGRLAPGVSMERAEEELKGIAANLAEEYTDTNLGWGVRIVPLSDEVFGDVRTPLLLLLGAVSLVLLIACVNVANLLLARGMTREREFATRAALGAGRGRLVRQLVTENLILAGIGGVLGLLVAWGGLQGIVKSAPDFVPRLGEASIDSGVVLFTLLTTLAAGLLFGVAPAFQRHTAGLAARLREGARNLTSGGRSSAMRGTLVVVEVALSLLLLSGAGLLIRSLLMIQGEEAGFYAGDAVTMRISLPGDRYAGNTERIAAFRALEERIVQDPAVSSAGFIWDVPLGGDRQGTGNWIEGDAITPENQKQSHITFASPGYFAAMDISVLAGRAFTMDDRVDSEKVVLVNQRFVDVYLQGRDPLKTRLHVGFDYREPRRIAGVVADVRHEDLRTPATPVVYLPYLQFPWGGTLSLVARPSRSAGDAIAAVRADLHSFDPSLRVYGVMRLDRVVADSLTRPRFLAQLLGIFAILALLLACIGVYGVIRYAVGQRMHEFGVRIALGAGRREILGLVLGRGLLLAAGGLIVGVAAALALNRVLASQLFEVSPTDPITLAATSLVLLASAVLASWLPAERATRADPVDALRQE